MNRKLTVAEIEDSITMLPAFPRIVLDLLATAGNETAGRRVLARFFRHDPISADRLQSWPEGGGSDQNMAWQREMALISSVADFAGLLGSEAGFLEHSLAVGIYAQELGQHCGLDREYALVAGLLHDIGRSWLACCHPRTHRRVVGLIEHSGRAASEIEREQFGMDHCEVGYHAARAWGLPAVILDAIAQHHRPGNGTLDCLAAATYLANMCSHGFQPRRPSDERPETVSLAVLRALGIDRAAGLGALPTRVEPHFQQVIAHWRASPRKCAVLPGLD